MITLITGGVRSGKSSFAQKLALKASSNPVNLATARIWDEDFRDRVARHQEDRGPEWESLEKEKNLGELDLSGRTVVVDCITLWLTNYFSDLKSDVDRCLEVFKKDLDSLLEQDARFYIITNEIGMGMHADTELGRKFADLHGWANQYAAEKADEVILMVAGQPLKVKSPKVE